MKYIFTTIALFGWLSLHGQSFIFNQFFRPSIRINSLYNHDFGWTTDDRLQVGQFDVNCIVPIASKFRLKMDWKKLLQLRLKKASKLKAYQLFWNFRPRLLYLQFDYQSPPSQALDNRPRLAYGLSTGLTGIHLLAKPLKKPKLLFYQVNIGWMEDYRSVQIAPIPSATLIIGLAHMKGLRFFWYYGLFFQYNNGRFTPAPFLGFRAKLAKKIWLNLTLPVQLQFSFKVDKKLKIDVGAGISSFSTALGIQGPQVVERHVFSDLRLRASINFNIKLSPRAILYLEAGAYPYHWPAFRWQQPTFEAPALGPSVYGSFSLFYSFKKALLGSTIDGIILF